ncbi:VOC family protein [Pseudorhodoferax sp.]|uniref:VOC family protein n=1 Tax=Pseudorhodoferax sp. TaxID=1993553 RepID=UPI002DD6A7EA|nr:VOC family protein [Pseudorhodoferax sp.]
MAVRLDHAVINVLTAMDAAVERFAALGFAPTARGHHSLGSINHLMMFEAGYLELVGLEPGATKVREEVASAPLGLNGLVFATDDAHALHRRLADAGVPVLAPVHFTRPVTIDGAEHTVGFTTVRVDPGYVHGGRVYYCQHHTPELVWHRPWLAHPNGADGIAEFVVVVDDPSDEAARYETLLDGVRFAPPHPDGTRCAALGDFRLTLSTAAAYLERYGDAGCSRVQASALPGGGCMGALVVRTASLAALRARLARDLHPALYRDDGDQIVIPARELWDCTLAFIGHASAYR